MNFNLNPYNGAVPFTTQSFKGLKNLKEKIALLNDYSKKSFFYALLSYFVICSFVNYIVFIASTFLWTETDTYPYQKGYIYYSFSLKTIKSFSSVYIFLS